MAWRVIQQGDRRWQVSVATERRPNVAGWSLVVCFRCPGQRPLWAPLPETSLSKADLYRSADCLSDSQLLELLHHADPSAGHPAKGTAP